MALVPQQLTDLRQGCAGSEQLGGEAVPKNMSPMVGIATDAGALESRPGDHRDRASGGKADARSKAAEEQPATRRLGPTMTQVGNDSDADISRDGDPCPLPALGANEHLAGSPIDIVQ